MDAWQPVRDLHALLSAQPGLFVALMGVLGLMFGSFINVVVHRLPTMLDRQWRAQCRALLAETDEAGCVAPDADAPPERYDLSWPPSRCPACGWRIRWYQNIPLLSWLFLRGRCASCQAAISMRYPLVELLTGVLFAAAAWQWGYSAQAVAAATLLAALVALTFIDLDTFLLPDDITLPLLWLGLLVNLNGLFAPLDEAVLGAALGYFSLWAVYHLFKRLTGKEGMGGGDFKLLAALGAWLGWKLLLPIVLLASLAGAVFGLALMLLAGHGRNQPLPFGPWLACGGALALFFGPDILVVWLGV